jgi:PAS domain S-box-containing protein
VGLERRQAGPDFEGRPLTAECPERERAERMRILVVEDEKDTAAVVRMLLEQELEAAVDIAPDCALARELLSSNTYDLITMDYQLPDGDGLSLLEEIVARETAPPVVMVTGQGDEKTAVSAFKLGASGYVVKDARMSTLLVEEARSALARAGLEFERRQLLSIFNSIDEIVYVSDPETYEVLYANRAIRKVFGDIVGMKCYEALQGSSEPCQFCTNDRIFGEHDGEAYIWEFKNTLDGRWYRCIDRAIRWPNGKAVRYEMAIDITDRKAAAEALRESEEKYRAVVEDQTELIVRFEQGGIMTFLNDAICSFTGLPREGLLGTSFMTFIPEDEQVYMQEQLDSLDEENSAAIVEHRVVLPSGEVRYMQWANRALFDEQGNIIEFQGVGRDITERKQAEEALRESEELYRKLVEASPEAIAVVDLKGNVLKLSESAMEMFGYSEEDLSGASLFDFVTDGYWDGVALNRETLIETGRVVGSEMAIRKKDGSEVFVEVNASTIKDEDGNPSAIVAVVRDITERKAAEEALRESEEKYRLLYDNAGEAIFSYDPELRLTEINRVGCEAIGYSREEMLGKNVLELNILHPRDSELAATVISRHFAGENVSKTEYTVIRKDGSERLFSVVGAAIRDPDGNLQSITNMCRDITDRKAAEEALRQSEEKFREFAENLPAVVFEADGLGKFVYVNANSFEDFGYTEEELYSGSLTVLEMLSEEDRERAAQGIQKILSEGPQGSNEYMARRKDGSTFPAIVSTLPVVKDGITVGLRGVLTNMTAQKEAEEALRRANEELKGYAHTVSHDLRGPLSAVAMAAEMLSSILEGDDGEALEGNAGEVLRLIRESTRRAVHMTENLLTLAQAGQSSATREPVDVSGVVRSILQEKEALLEDHGVRVSLDDDLGVVAMDPTHAYQVFSNLIGNAIKHNDGPEPQVEVRLLTADAPGTLRYLVKDNGPGIPDGEMEDIFLPFHKGPNSTDTGIGLSIVDKVVRLYGGQVRAYNDGGACFEFTLPMQSP